MKAEPTAMSSAYKVFGIEFFYFVYLVGVNVLSDC